MAPATTRRDRLRLERQDAEAPVRDPLLDSRRILTLAQELARAQRYAPIPEPLSAGQDSE